MIGGLVHSRSKEAHEDNLGLCQTCIVHHILLGVLLLRRLLVIRFLVANSHAGIVPRVVVRVVVVAAAILILSRR